MSEIVKNCKVHGELIISQVFKDGSGYRCKVCRIQSRVKDSYSCKHHGELTLDNVTTRGQCRICHRKTAGRSRNNDRTAYNAKVAADKIKNPEKWEKIFKKDYEAKKVKYGKLLSLHKQCKARGITTEQYSEMLIKQNNKCMICEQEEKRIDGVTKEIGRLTIDHCHKTNKVRGLLCHNCNVAIGSFRDDTVRMYRAIRYIKQGGL